MEYSNDLLKNLQEELQQSEQGIQNAQQGLQKAQNAVKELTAKKMAQQRLLDDIKAAQAATDKQRQTVQKEVADAQAVYDGLYPKLDAKLTDEQRQAIGEAVKAVDDEITGLEAELEALQEQKEQAEAAAAKVQEQVKEKEDAYQEIQNRLRQLPADIQAGQANVARLRAALKSAADNLKTAEAYFLAGELKGALDNLADLLKPETEAAWVNDLVSRWQELRSAKAEAAGKTAVLEQLQGQLKAKEQEPQRKVQGRQTVIKAKLLAIPAQSTPEAAPATGSEKQSQPVAA